LTDQYYLFHLLLMQMKEKKNTKVAMFLFVGS
jgi:hypothetical protein